MDDVRPHPGPRPEPVVAGLVRAALLASAAGALVGALEALSVVAAGTDEVRYTRWAARIPLAAALAHALFGAALALPAWALARGLAGRPGHRAAPPSACAGLGAAAGLAVFALSGRLSGATLVAAALATTLLFVTLRELLAWWPRTTRPLTWWALTALALAADALLAHRLAHTGSGSALALALAAAGALGAVAVLATRRRLAWTCALPWLALLVQAAGGYPRGAADANPADGARPPSVLHVSIDTLRPDRLGCYGNAAARTPTIDRLAAEGVLFEETVAQANTTGPSHTTQLTGLYPAEHGALANMVPISGHVPTTPDLLAALGYETAGFVSGFTLVEAACGLASRFDYYDDNHLAWHWLPQAAERIALLNRVVFRLAGRAGTRVTRSDRPAGSTAEAALDWLAARAPGAAPFYLFLHFYDPHAPYEPPPEHAPWPARLREFDWYRLDSVAREALVADPAARDHMLALYDGEISYADAQLGRVLEALETRGQLDETLVIITSDHGEGLGPHGYWYDHGTFLYDEELHVPLILRLPGARHAGVRVKGQTRLLDLAPTVLELCGLDGPPPTSGASLVPHLDGTPATERPTFARAEMSGDVSSFALDGRRLALRAGGFKLLWTSPHWQDTERLPARIEFFDLRQDPAELHDLSAEPPPEAADLEAQLLDWNETTQELVERGRPTPELLEHMRALGYL